MQMHACIHSHLPIHADRCSSYVHRYYLATFMRMFKCTCRVRSRLCLMYCQVVLDQTACCVQECQPGVWINTPALCDRQGLAHCATDCKCWCWVVQTALALLWQRNAAHSVRFLPEPCGTFLKGQQVMFWTQRAKRQQQDVTKPLCTSQP